MDSPFTKSITEDETQLINQGNYLVILYNDDVHTVGDVIHQVCKAIHCSIEVAEAIVSKVEANGSAPVYVGDKPSCSLVCSVLEEIQLLCKIVKE